LSKIKALLFMVLPIIVVVISSYALEMVDKYWYMFLHINMNQYLLVKVIGSISVGLSLFLSEMHRKTPCFSYGDIRCKCII